LAYSAEADVLPNRIPLPKAMDIEGSFCTLNSFIPTCHPTKAKAYVRRPSAKQAVPVTIACRPKPKEINNQIVKDHFQYCKSNPGNIER
jgi:hypothetical protein